MTNLDKESLEKLSIHELRDVARNIGVHLPTTFKRDDLANEILAIYNGEKEPYKRKTKQGRPPKIQRNFNDASELLLPDDANEYSKFPFKMPEFMFNAHSLVYENVKVESFSGILYNYGNYGVICCGETKVYITISLINEYGLVSGDEIRGNFRTISNDRNLVQEILTINGFDKNEYKVQSVQKLSPNTKLKVKENSILVGGTNLLYNHIEGHEIEKAIEGYEVVSLNINVKKQSSLNNVYNISFKLSDKEIFEQSMAVLHSAKRRAEVKGVKVILVVNSLTELIKIYNSCLTENATIFEIKSSVIKDVKEIMTSTFNSNMGSFTIVDNENKNLQPSLQEILNYELYKFFDVVND